MSPPDIPGYTFERLLGSGGYSDVFLYHQEMPRRPVAIKVLVADRFDERSLRQVAAEANAMAAVSTHPYIVTIFRADLEGAGAANPFLVMEYYPRPNYSVRARTEQLSVAEVLRAGIQVASAVETAHRVGIIHRDIKPANILTSEYGRPGLTDFGIAGLADGASDPAEGLSVPWSPPEIVNGANGGDVTSDVYSLGATVYSLLAGRSPHEVVGGTNRTLDLLERIDRGDVPPTGRGDVPPALERLLRHAMARRSEDRPSSAADLARALQDIEVQQQLAMTPLEVRDEGGPAPRSRASSDEEDGTRLKSPTVIQSQRPVSPTGSTGPLGSNGPPGSTGPPRPSGSTGPTTGVPDPSGHTVRSVTAGTSGGSGPDGLLTGVPGSAPEGATVHRSALTGDPAAFANPAVADPVSWYGPSVGSPPPAAPPSTAPPSTAQGQQSTGTAYPGGAPTDGMSGASPMSSGRPARDGGDGSSARSRKVVRAAWIVLVVVILLAAVRIAMGGTEPTTTTTTSDVVVGTAGGFVSGSKPHAPSDVRIDTESDGRLVAHWTAPEDAAKDDTYIVTPAGAGIEAAATFPQPKPGETSVVVPAGTTCISVYTQRGTVQSKGATIPNCNGDLRP